MFAIVVDSKGTIYFDQTYSNQNYKLQKIDRESGQVFQLQDNLCIYGNVGGGSGSNLAIDKQDYLYSTLYTNSFICKYDSNGHLIKHFATVHFLVNGRVR